MLTILEVNPSFVRIKATLRLLVERRADELINCRIRSHISLISGE